MSYTEVDMSTAHNDGWRARDAEIENLEAEIEHLKAGLHDCRLCYHYHEGYIPCKAVAKCEKGNLWTRTKVIQVWA